MWFFEMFSRYLWRTETSRYHACGRVELDGLFGRDIGAHATSMTAAWSPILWLKRSSVRHKERTMTTMTQLNLSSLDAANVKSVQPVPRTIDTSADVFTDRSNCMNAYLPSLASR